MEIIVKRVNKGDKKDFPDSIVTIQLGRHVAVLTQKNIEEIITKLLKFSERQKR